MRLLLIHSALLMLAVLAVLAGRPFVKTRSALAWPTPFEFSQMGALLTSWRRHAYDRLRWKKASGAQLDMVWRAEQGFHAETGRADGHLQIAPVVTITPKDPAP